MIGKRLRRLFQRDDPRVKAPMISWRIIFVVLGIVFLLVAVQTALITHYMVEQPGAMVATLASYLTLLYRPSVPDEYPAADGSHEIQRGKRHGGCQCRPSLQWRAHGGYGSVRAAHTGSICVPTEIFCKGNRHWRCERIRNRMRKIGVNTFGLNPHLHQDASELPL